MFLDMEQLLIFLIIGEIQDWNPVLDLKSERVDQVVDDHDIVQVSVLDDPQVLNVKPIMSLHAVLSMEDSVNGLVLFVQMSNDGLGIVNRWGSENINEEVLAHSVQKLKAMGSDVEPELVAIQFKVHVRFFIIEDRMNQRFVKVQHQQLLRSV